MIGFLSVWEKYAPETQWCTVDGRSEIYSSTSSPITAAQCQAKCVNQDSDCRAVEFWEAYNYACFKCTDTTKITAYTYTDDLAYPVYVWVKCKKKYNIKTIVVISHDFFLRIVASREQPSLTESCKQNNRLYVCIQGNIMVLLHQSTSAANTRLVT